MSKKVYSNCGDIQQGITKLNNMVDGLRREIIYCDELDMKECSKISSRQIERLRSQIKRLKRIKAEPSE